MEKRSFKSIVSEYFHKVRDNVHDWKLNRENPHKSFERSYREDFNRETTKLPGSLALIVASLKLVFSNKKIFFSLILGALVLNIIFVGLMSESTYVTFQDAIDDTSEAIVSGSLGSVAKAGLLLVSTITTGGLQSGFSEIQIVFLIIIFLLIWLISVYASRLILAGHKPKFRTVLYDACAPLISTFVVLAVVFVYLIPIFITIIVYSSAVSTGFLDTPFYAFISFCFALALVVLSLYLLSSALLGLVAVTNRGAYPITSLKIASNLIRGRRIKFIIRLLSFVLFLVVLWIIVVVPIIVLDLWLKNDVDFIYGVPIIPVVLSIMTTFSFVFFSVYIYTIYRRLLDDPA
jgi:hypothetical protein